MLVKLFKELIDYKWYLAFVVLFLLFLPLDFNNSSTIINHGLLVFIGDSISFSSTTVKLINVLSVLGIILMSVFFRITLSSFKIINKGYHIGLLMGIMYFAFWQKELPSFLELLSVIFLFVSVFQILKIEHSKQADLLIFNSCLLISSAVALDFRFLVFFPLAFIGLFLYRLFSFRVLVLGIIGLLLPHLFLFTINFVFLDKLDYFLRFYLLFIDLDLSFLNLKQLGIRGIISVSMLTLLFLSAIFKISDKKIFVRRMTTLLVWVFILFVFLFFIEQDSISYIAFVFSMFFGFFASFSMVKVFKKKLFIYTLNILYVILIVLNFLNLS